MTPDISGPDRPLPKKRAGRHRAPHRKQQLVVRTIGVGAVAGCIAFVAEMNAPDAEALSIIIPTGAGNATQINILQGNIFDPELGLGGNGNTSHNSTIGNLIFGLGNNTKGGSSGGLLFGTIALGGATGNGNVTQVNILSYNIINPQFSLTGNNISNNQAINNVSENNGNGSGTSTDSSLVGGAVGNGNTIQLAILSGNIFNPQFALFGSNVSNNLAITNVAANNGNGSTSGATSSGLLGTSMFGMTGNGNTIQLAGITSNIINPQFSLLGTNESHNTADTNDASANGNGSNAGVGSTGGLGNNTTIGVTGNGVTDQYGAGTGNIFNDQFRLGLGSLVPSTSTTPTTGTTPTPGTTQTALTNEQVSSGSNTDNGSPGLSAAELLALESQQPGTTSATGVAVPGTLKQVVSQVKNAVTDTINKITKKQTNSAASQGGN